MKSTDFTLVHDDIKTQVCLDCGNVYSPNGEWEIDYCCHNCKSEQLSNTTFHEDAKCSFCEENICIGNDAFIHMRSNKVMCIVCFEEVFGEEALKEWKL